MSKPVTFILYELPDTPSLFYKDKFLSGDQEQIKLYKSSKKVNRKKTLTYEDITKDSTKNYARVVPEGCMFIDFDDEKQAKEMYEIIVRSKLKCLILETQHGYHFLFRTPDFYEKEMTDATNWLGYKFDCKATTKTKTAVQIMRVCGMNRKEVCSWNPTEPILPTKLNIEELDILPYWLCGKLKDSELHKEGKTGSKDDPTHDPYTLTDNPFTELMTMREGGRHNHIVSRCSYFGLSNGFEIEEFKDLITAIHDQYLVKIGTPMPDSDLFGDLDGRWADYEAMLLSEGWIFEEEKRRWKKVTKKKNEKIDERRASEYLFKNFDFYGINPKPNGTFSGLLYKDKEGAYDYRKDVTKLRKALRDYSDQNFKDPFFKEMEGQLMQLCAENGKIISRTDKYIIVKNKVLSCINPEAFDFSWLDTNPPTDVVLPWNWYPESWVEEHEEDLGGQITWFIEQLSRNSRGIPQPIVQDWLWVVAGASMVPANELQKIIVMAGGGQNGKSLYTSLIRLCLGEEMYNQSKIFDYNPHHSFWGENLDHGILCVVDDLNRTYNRDAFSYVKGAVTGTDRVVINEKFKPKRELPVLPQIIACTNFDFELYDKSDGMKRRVKILPTEFHVDDKDKDIYLQHKLVLNVTDRESVVKYRMSESAFGDIGKRVMNMHTRENGVLESLDHGSLAWFANKARYMYFKYVMKEIILDDTEDMKTLCEHAFKNEFEIQCEEFIKWHLEKHKGTKVNCFFGQLRKEYEEEFCEEAEIVEIMTEKQFNKCCGSIIKKLGYKTTKRRNDNNIPSTFYLFIPEE